MAPDVQSILLVEAQKLPRQALAVLIESLGNFEVKWQASDADEALTAIDQHRPSLLVISQDLCGRSGTEVLHEIRRRRLPARALLLTCDDSEKAVRHALAAGARGCVLKTDSAEELRNALVATARNERYVPPSYSTLRNAEIAPVGAASAESSDPLAALSNREREIFHLLAGGMQNATIAKQLFISPRTVETHRARIVRKLGLSSNAELIRFAIKHGLSSVE